MLDELNVSNLLSLDGDEDMDEEEENGDDSLDEDEEGEDDGEENGDDAAF